MDSTPQLASVPGKPVKIVGAIAFLLGIGHAWVAAMHWSHHHVTSQAFGFAAAGILIPFLFAYAIAGRRKARDWNKVGLWFFLVSIVIQIALVHGVSTLGVYPR
jgi:hypothetical protein